MRKSVKSRLRLKKNSTKEKKINKLINFVIILYLCTPEVWGKTVLK
jgi:hypothetical protein